MPARRHAPWLALLPACLMSATLAAAPPQLPRIALIMDDLGHALPAGLRTLALDAPVAVAILPHTPHATRLARAARESGKEVLLHLPLQAVGQPGMEPGLIHMDMSRRDLAEELHEALAMVPGARGVNTHRGSLLTRHPGHMDWLMQELKAVGGLYFVDSYTTAQSIALQIAREHALPAARRDVFLDHDPAPERIHAEFERLKALALRQGQAIAIGHPYPTTLDYLETALAGLEESGFRLVPVSELTGPRP